MEKILFFLGGEGGTGESFLEICPENKRDQKTFEALIQKRVRVGTKILTDGWAGYKQLGKLGNIFGRFGFFFIFIIEISGYFWDFVNHSENFANLRNFVNFRFYNLGEFQMFHDNDFVILKSFFQFLSKELSK